MCAFVPHQGSGLARIFALDCRPCGSVCPQDSVKTGVGDVNVSTMNPNMMPAGLAPPWDITVVVEVPMLPDGANTDEAVRRRPGNYGFVPGTLMPDGGPCQALVVGSVPVLSGARLRSRPIGLVAFACDDGGELLGLVAGAIERHHPFFTDTASYQCLSSQFLDQIETFLGDLRNAAPDRSVRQARWGDAEEAAHLILEAMERHRLAKRDPTGGPTRVK